MRHLSSCSAQAVFLGGEWGVVDYNVPNKILCIVFCGSLVDIYGSSKILKHSLEVIFWMS